MTANQDSSNKDEAVCRVEVDLTQNEVLMLGMVLGIAMKHEKEEDLNPETISFLFEKFGRAMENAGPWREPSK